MPPTVTATLSMPPTAAPSLPEPSKSPTLTPTPGPVRALTRSFFLFCLPEIVYSNFCIQTYAPMPSLMASFFCGIDWNDAITNCKRRCPTGEVCETSLSSLSVLLVRSAVFFFFSHRYLSYIVSPQSALSMRNVLALRHVRKN